MQAVIDPVNYPSVCDTVIMGLADSASFQIITLATGVINTHGLGVFNLTGLLPGHRYYLVVRTRNAIETWSKYSMLFDNAVKSYDFTR